MRRKKYSRNQVKAPISIRSILIKTILIVSLVAVAGLTILNSTLKPALISFSEVEIKKVATSTIANSINEMLLDNNELELDRFIRFIPATGNEPYPSVKYNRNNLAEIESDINQLVQTSISDRDGFIILVPVGRFAKSPLLDNLGPKIPIQLKAMGESKTQIKSKFKPVGMNTIHGEFSATIKMNVQLRIPVATKVTTLVIHLPIAKGTIYNSDE